MKIRFSNLTKNLNLGKAKKGQGDLPSVLTGLAVAALLIGVLGLIYGYTLDIQKDIRDDFVTNVAGCNSTDTGSCPAEYNAVNNSMGGIVNMAGKTDNVGTIVIGSSIILILVSAFGFLFSRKFGQ